MASPDPVHSFHLSSRLGRTMAGCVFLLVLAMGAASTVWSMATKRVETTLGASIQARLMSGEAARSLAAELARAPLPLALADAERAVAWLAFGALGPRVRKGCEPWLFLDDELKVHPGAQHNAHARLVAIALVSQRLRRHGIELLVATVPNKSRVQHDQLCGLYRPATSADRLSEWEAGLSRHGVAHVDLLSALDSVKHGGQAQPFLRIDTHWTQAGADAAAQAVARAVSEAGLSLTPFQPYRVETGALHLREGDLVRLAGIDWLPMSLLPPKDMVVSAEFSADTAPGLENASAVVKNTDDTSAFVDAANAADDLFGDSSLPSVALIGTSYSRTSSFTQFLEVALSTPVPNFAKDGGDFWEAAKAYLASAEFRDTPPRLVVWEMPERVLQMPVAPQERAWFQALQTARENGGAVN